MFDWDEANVDHIEGRHAISVDEAEEAYLDVHRQTLAAYRVPGEQRHGLIGATAAGRVLVLIYTRRQGAIRIITARDADTAEKRRYRRRK
jgi:uncharacterized DUF497 family protein